MFEILGVNELVEDDPSVRMRDELARRFRAGDISIPPVPALALELNRLALDPDIDKATELAEHDPNVAARVLQVASSALMGAAAPPSNLRAAVARLGVNHLRDIATMILMQRQFSCSPLQDRMADLLVHAFVVGSVTARVCRLARIAEPHAFLAGLMHDIGQNFVVFLLGELSQEDPGWLEPSVVNACAEELHEDAGAMVCKKWALPDVICLVAQHHSDRAEPATASPLVAAVALADFAAQQDCETLEKLATALETCGELNELSLGPDAPIQIATWVSDAKNDPVVRQLAGG